MSADPIDELAERLFASARGEGASERLVQRVLADVASADGRRAERSPRPSPARVRAMRPFTGMLLAAAACVMAAVAWSTIEPPRPAPPISAELGPRSEHGPHPVGNVDTTASSSPALPAAPAAAPRPTEPQSPSPAATPRELSEPSEPSVPQQRAPSRRAPSATRPPRATPLPAAAEAVPPSPPADTTGTVAPSVHDVAETPAAPPSLSDELQALERARAALRGGDGRAALRLLDGDGTAPSFTRLAAEATLLRIEALYAVGELAESRRLAEEFTTQNPDSHLGDRARSFIRRVDASRNAAGGGAPR